LLTIYIRITSKDGTSYKEGFVNNFGSLILTRQKLNYFV